MTCGNVIYEYVYQYLVIVGTAFAVAIGFAVWWLRRK
jgi:hypothetical protein